jgi:hypothetical protein
MRNPVVPLFRTTLVTLLAGFLLLGFIPAGAAQVKYRPDPKGDTMTYLIDRGQWLSTPRNENGDIRGVRLNNAKKAVIVKVNFVKLLPSAPTVRQAQYTVDLFSGDGTRVRSVAEFIMAPSNPVATSSAYGNQVVCTAKATWAFGDNQLTLRFPGHCFTKRNRVRAVVNTNLLLDRHDGDYHQLITDTARSKGYVRRK